MAQATHRTAGRMNDWLKFALNVTLAAAGAFLASWLVLAEKVTVGEHKAQVLERRVEAVEAALRSHVADDSVHRDKAREKLAEVDNTLARVNEGLGYIRERINELVSARRR